VHPSTLTGILRRLEERGFLRRRKDPNDGRRALLWLTPKGKRINDVRSGTVEAAVGEALSQVTPEALAGAHETINALQGSLQQQLRDSNGKEAPGAPAMQRRRRS
jgi:DNA-binding MarR family transcriptional regulator